MIMTKSPRTVQQEFRAASLPELDLDALLAKVDAISDFASAAFTEIEHINALPDDEMAKVDQVSPGDLHAWFAHAHALRPSVVLRLCEAVRMIVDEYREAEQAFRQVDSESRAAGEEETDISASVAILALKLALRPLQAALEGWGGRS
jgi:uncharacterized protein YukE